ncbi:MAG: tryptophan-rich sensory protein [Pedobacter sp.]|nr:MAG: tryptophan-rich sensory protein [Pedobacter sp.]
MRHTLPIVNGIALVSTVFVNYLSNSGAFNGNTMKTVSDRYFNLFTPAGYAFSIWGLIYLGLFCFTIYTGRSLFTKQEPHPALSKIGWWFVISCICNSLWVTAWLYDYTLLSVGLMVMILISLLNIITSLNISLKRENNKNYWLISIPFTLYVGWISVAIIANIAAYLTRVKWDGFGIDSTMWTIGMIVIAGFVNVYMITQRNMRAFGAVGIWALLAIAANQSTDSSAIVYTCYGISTAILLSTIINMVKPKTL